MGLKCLYEKMQVKARQSQIRRRSARIQARQNVAQLLRVLYNHPKRVILLLMGDLAGFWSVTVRANWRVIFRFEGEDAADVDYVDYH